MNPAVEIDFVVTDCLQALPCYERVFGAERIEATNLAKGQNEAVFTIFGTRFHILDENPEFQMFAPKEGASQSLWFNVVVPDIKAVHGQALESSCTEIQPITAMPEMGASNSMFQDPFGYMWMLHQIDREVSFEDRMHAMGHEV